MRDERGFRKINVCVLCVCAFRDAGSVRSLRLRGRAKYTLPPLCAIEVRPPFTYVAILSLCCTCACINASLRRVQVVAHLQLLLLLLLLAGLPCARPACAGPLRPQSLGCTPWGAAQYIDVRPACYSLTSHHRVHIQPPVETAAHRHARCSAVCAATALLCRGLALPQPSQHQVDQPLQPVPLRVTPAHDRHKRARRQHGAHRSVHPAHPLRACHGVGVGLV